MSNIFDETRYAVNQAKTTLRAADSVANDMAFLLIGRLHHCSPQTLVRLKRELKNFNSQTREWKK